MNKYKNFNIFKSKSFYLLTYLFLQFFIIESFSQQNDLALLSGTIKNDLGIPVGLELRFLTPNSMPAITRSNTDGTYQQVVKQGKTYLPIFKGYMEIGGFHFFDIGKFDKYQEFRRDFIVRPIEVGKEVATANFFEPGDTVFSEEGKKFMLIFKEFFSINKNINCTAYLSEPTMTFKAKTITKEVEVKGKIKKVKVKISAKDVETEFLQIRANQILKRIKDFDLPAKVFDFSYEFPKKTKSKKGNELPNNARIVISKVLKI